ncbi:hypothetical protein [Bacillus thuringiensis]|nr:hypothetical protein [Bacillus thuringiensis]
MADQAYHTWLPHQHLALCYQALGEQEEVIFHEQQTKSYQNVTKNQT